MDAFNRDSFIKKELGTLIGKFGIKTIIETGTYLGQTTEEFSKIVDNVLTIEINESYYASSKSKLKKYPNVKCLLGSSPNKMSEILSASELNKPVLFYLDAHWGNYNPLIDELKRISLHKMKCSVIAIHDFKVPNKDFGYDNFPNGEPYSFEIIKSEIENIYGKDGYEYKYNDVAEGACRGIIYIYPKKIRIY